MRIKVKGVTGYNNLNYSQTGQIEIKDDSVVSYQLPVIYYDNKQRIIIDQFYKQNPFTIPGVVLIAKEYVAYCDLHIDFDGFDIILSYDNVRRKEKYGGDSSKAMQGLTNTAEHIKYVKDCGADDYCLTGKFV